MPTVVASKSNASPINEELCLTWLNSCLSTSAGPIRSLNKGLSAEVFITLIEDLTGVKILIQKDGERAGFREFEKIAEFLKEEEIDYHIDPRALADGDSTEVITALWLTCLHFDIHSHKRASYQRTVRLGKRFMLDWIADENEDKSFQDQDNFVSCFSNGIALQELVCKYHKDFDKDSSKGRKEMLRNVFDAIQSKWGIAGSSFSPDALADETMSEISLLVYLAILRRKILQENKSSSPAKGPSSETSQVEAETAKQRLVFQTESPSPKPGDTPPRDESNSKDRSLEFKDFFAKLQLSPAKTGDLKSSQRTLEISPKPTPTKTASDGAAVSSVQIRQVLQLLAQEQDEKNAATKPITTSSFGSDDSMTWKANVRDFNRNWALEFETNSEGVTTNATDNSQGNKTHRGKDEKNFQNRNCYVDTVSENGGDVLLQQAGVFGDIHGNKSSTSGFTAVLHSASPSNASLVSSIDSIAMEAARKPFENTVATKNSIPMLTVQSPTPPDSDSSDREFEAAVEIWVAGSRDSDYRAEKYAPDYAGEAYDAYNDADNDAYNDDDNDAYNNADNDANNDAYNDVYNDADNDANNDADNDAYNDADNDAYNDADNDVYNDADNDAYNDADNDAYNDADYDAYNDAYNDYAHESVHNAADFETRDVESRADTQIDLAVGHNSGFSKSNEIINVVKFALEDDNNNNNNKERDDSLSLDDSDRLEELEDSTDQANASLWTSWSEHQLSKEITQPGLSDDFITFENRQQSSPAITWGSTRFYEGAAAASDSDEDGDRGILQTSAQSATELRIALEKCGPLSLDNGEVYDVTNKKTVETRPRLWEKEERTDKYLMGYQRFSVDSPLGNNVLADSYSLASKQATIVSLNNGNNRFDPCDKLNDCLDDLHCLALLKSRDLEQGRLEAVQRIRLGMEESCDGIPIDKISSVVFDHWRQTIDSIIENNDLRSQESEEKRDGLLREMRAELDVLARENFDLTKTATDASSLRAHNDLLRKQLSGLENYVTSLESRVEVQGKENGNLLHRLESFQDELSTKQTVFDRNRKDSEAQISHLRDAVAEANEARIKVDVELKMKDIEKKKLQNELDGIKDESKTDFERIQIDAVSLRTKVTELLQQNEALKTANEADQTIIKHLETKMLNFENLFEQLKKEKREILIDLQESRIREKNLINKIAFLDENKNVMIKTNQDLMKQMKAMGEEKNTLNRELHAKISNETQSTEAMLGELKNLEKSLNDVRKEKSLVEERYNMMKYENERLLRNLELTQRKLKNRNKDHNRGEAELFKIRSATPNSFSGNSSVFDSEAESLDSYAGFPDRLTDLTLQSTVPSVLSPVPNVFIVKSHDKAARSATKSSAITPSTATTSAPGTKYSRNRDSITDRSYAVEDTRSWLRDMETKLQQTDQVLKSVKKNPHVKV